MYFSLTLISFQISLISRRSFTSKIDNSLAKDTRIVEGAESFRKLELKRLFKTIHPSLVIRT